MKLKTIAEIINSNTANKCREYADERVKQMIIEASRQAFDAGTYFGYANGTSGTCYETESEFNSINSYIKAISNENE